MRRFPAGVGDPVPAYSTPIVRGVVVAVYFADGQEERAVSARQRDPKFYGVKNVAVDVLTYGGRFRAYLSKVPVVPRRHALNDYEGLWVPRASTIDLSTGGAPVLGNTAGTPSDPRDLDGDHVLVEFLDNDPSQPFIRDELPHPRASYTQLQAAGPAVESRFRGVVSRIDTDGNVTLDTTRANSGGTDAAGAETPALDAAHGRVTLRMNHNAPFVLTGVDDEGGDEKFRIEIDPATNLFRIRLDNGLSLEVSGRDGDAVLQLGDGAVNPAIFQNLQTWWNTVAWPAIQAAFDTHVHASAMGPTAPPVPLMAPLAASAGTLAPDVQATQARIPNG